MIQDPIFQKLSLLEYMATNFEVDICFIEQIIAALDELQSMLPENKDEVVIVHAEVGCLLINN